MGKIRLELEDGEESIEQQWVGQRVEFRLWVEPLRAFKKAQGKVVRQKFLGYVTTEGERQQEYELTIANNQSGYGKSKTAVVRSVNNYVAIVSP